MSLEHQLHCVNMSPLDTAANSQYLCLLCCLGTREERRKDKESVNKRERETKRVKVQRGCETGEELMRWEDV